MGKRFLQRLPALDGLRGIAILLVLLYHYGLFPAGWCGVQLFFCLSGFLITQRLLETRTRGMCSYLFLFYARRILRIFPAYYLYLTGIAIFWFFSGEPDRFSRDFFYLLTYTFNFQTPGLVRPDYQATDLYYYLHFWSLCIEEQFYLIWPLLCFFVNRDLFRYLFVVISLTSLCFRWQFGLTAAMGVSIQPACWTVYTHPLAQLDGFVWGAALAFIHWERWEYWETGRWWNGAYVSIVLAFSGLAAAWPGPLQLIDDLARHAWLFPLLACASTLVILQILRGEKGVAFLTLAPLRRLGRVSYGMYIIHMVIIRGYLAIQPENGIFQIGSIAAGLACLLLAWLLAELSFRWLEFPLIRWGRIRFSG